MHYQVLQKATNDLTPIPLPHESNLLLVGMVDFQNPAVIMQDARACTFPAILYRLRITPSPPLTVALTKLWHTVGGLYMCVRHAATVLSEYHA